MESIRQMVKEDDKRDPLDRLGKWTNGNRLVCEMNSRSPLANSLATYRTNGP